MPKHRGVSVCAGRGEVVSGRFPHGVLERSKFQRRVPTVLKVTIILGAFVFFALKLTYSRSTQDAITTLDLSSVSSGGQKKLKAQAGRRMDGKTVAYVISVTADGPYMDGAAVLAHSIRKASTDSKYGIDLIAMVHPNVTTSRAALMRAGWKVLERDIPLDINEIQGDYLRERIAKNGCCGATELLKLYAWRLTDYHRVVHLDMDSLLLQPLDELFDLSGKDFLYTCDYGMMTRGSKACPVQGGFLILKPNEEDFKRLVNTVKLGDFRAGSAWGGEHIGWYWGGMTIQGLLPYYFHKLTDPTRAKEVDRCVYNNMFDNPECKNASIPMIKNVHFTVCQKPWTCTTHAKNAACTPFMEKWFQLRRELESMETGAYGEACVRGNYRPLEFLQDDVPAVATGGAATP
ncbi:Hypothetical protein NocV09_00601550 [Nannochloropsis oceanica]